MKVAFRFFGTRAVLASDGETLSRRYIGLLAAAFVVIFGLLWAYTASLPMAFLSRDYPAWVAKRTLLNSCDIGNVAIFGDSRTMAGVIPKSLPYGGSNFAFSGSSPIEAYFAVKRMLRCKIQPQVVVLAYSVGNYTFDSDYWTISSHVGVLNFADMRNVQRVSHLLRDGEINHSAADDHLAPLIREALVATRFPSFYFGSLIDGFGFGRYRYNLRMRATILSDRGHALFGTVSGSDDVASEFAAQGFVPSPLVNSYFRSILAAMAKRNIPVVLMSLPINEATCRVMSPALRPALIAYLRHTIAEDPKASMEGPTMPCWPDRYFGDAFHLNASGAQRYTKLVAHWLPQVKPRATEAAQIVER